MQQRIHHVELDLRAGHRAKRRRVLVVMQVPRRADDHQRAVEIRAGVKVSLPVFRHEDLKDGAWPEALAGRRGVAKGVALVVVGHELRMTELAQRLRREGGVTRFAQIALRAEELRETRMELRAPDDAIRIRPKVDEADSMIRDARLRNEAGGGVRERGVDHVLRFSQRRAREVAADDHPVGIPIERRPEGIVVLTRRREVQIEHDRPRAGRHQPVEDQRVDTARPGPVFTHQGQCFRFRSRGAVDPEQRLQVILRVEADRIVVDR